MKRPKSQLAAAALPVPIETSERRIYLIRSQKVMLDSDLADLYQVPTKSLNLAVRRNADRFPEDFSFQLTKEEVSSLRFQFETSNKGRGGRRHLPHAFTEHGVANTASRSARPPSSGAPCRLTSSLDAPFISFGQSRPLGESNSLAGDWERA